MNLPPQLTQTRLLPLSSLACPRPPHLNTGLMRPRSHPRMSSEEGAEAQSATGWVQVHRGLPHLGHLCPRMFHMLSRQRGLLSWRGGPRSCPCTAFCTLVRAWVQGSCAPLPGHRCPQSSLFPNSPLHAFTKQMRSDHFSTVEPKARGAAALGAKQATFRGTSAEQRASGPFSKSREGHWKG